MTKIIGTENMAKKVAAKMPPITAIPIASCYAVPALFDKAKGAASNIDAIDVSINVNNLEQK
jgi:hypothetical protein